MPDPLQLPSLVELYDLVYDSLANLDHPSVPRFRSVLREQQRMFRHDWRLLAFHCISLVEERDRCRIVRTQKYDDVRRRLPRLVWTSTSVGDDAHYCFSRLMLAGCQNCKHRRRAYRFAPMQQIVECRRVAGGRSIHFAATRATWGQ